MAGFGDVAYESGSHRQSQENLEDGSRWYFSRKEIEESSPSRVDGVDLKKEAYLRKSYCTFLQDLGMRLKVPQVTIATAIIFCHRFFLRQSHGKNDRRTMATVCMFLAGKVEETPRPLKDVIIVSYEIIHKKDPTAVQRIKQKEVYEQQKELILVGERVVLATLGFDLNVQHPYKPLVEAIKKFKVAQNALAQVAWNFVNDGLRTSLCLQFKPHHIAAGAIFLAAKFLKVKLPSDGEKVWWQEFDVTPRQLEEVSNQMLELYEQNRVPPSSDVEGSAASGVTHRAPAKTTTSNEEQQVTNNTHSQAGSTRPVTAKPSSSSRPPSESNHGNADTKSGTDLKVDGSESRDNHHHHSEPEELPEAVSEGGAVGADEQPNSLGRIESDKHLRQSAIGRSPQEAIKKIDRDKVKAALEKRRKSIGDGARKTDVMDDDDLIERELEDGIELASSVNEKSKRDRKPNWPKPTSSNRPEDEDRNQNNVEEGEVSMLDDDDNDGDDEAGGGGGGYQSLRSNSRKRKAGSPPANAPEAKQRHDH